MTRRYMLYALIFVAGFVSVSLFSFYLFTHPSKIDVPYTPEGAGLPREDVSLTTDDGTTIAGWHMHSTASPDRALLILHGYPASKADMLLLARDLYPAFSLLLIDLRYFGESGGSATTLGITEGEDVAAAVHFLSERYERIGIFGYSFGGSIALMHAARNERVGAVASYGAFSDLRSLGYDTYSNLWVLKYPLVELMNLWARMFYGEWAHSVSPVAHAEAITQPVFIGYTGGDPVIPASHSERLIAALEQAGNAPVTYRAEGTSHMGLPDDLGERLRAFFKERL